MSLSRYKTFANRCCDRPSIKETSRNDVMLFLSRQFKNSSERVNRTDFCFFKKRAKVHAILSPEQYFF